MSVITQRAKYLARMVHFNEIRRDGQPYYIHPENVAESLKDKGETIVCTAYLHDTLENAENPDTIRKLISDYFPSEVLDLVEILTHDENISYLDYIRKVCNNPSALIIKIADIINNTKDIDLPNYPQRQKEKYRNACKYMISKGIDVPEILKERLKIGDKI